ncbi:MAG: pilus assembly protein PilM [Actinomycetota bacterium]
MGQHTSTQRRVVGVTIDGDTLRAVEIHRRLRGHQAVAVGEVQIPGGVRTVTSAIDAEAVSAGLKELWKASSFKTKNVAFGINGRDTTMRPMKVPRAAADDIGGYVRYQLADYLPYGLENAVIDHLVVDDPQDENAIEVLAIGVPVELVETIATAISDAGLDVASIDAVPTALATAIDPIAADDNEGDAVVSVDGTRTTVVLRSDGKPRMVRVLSAGGGDHAAQLADELEGMIARVEGHQQGGPGTEPVLAGQDRRFAEAADAVAAAINYDLREHTGTGVDHVIVTGAFGRFEILHQLIASATSTSVAAAMPPSWWPQGQADDFDDYDHYVEAAGLAWSHLNGLEDSFDLNPPSVREATANRRELTIGVGVAGAIVAAGLVTVLPYRSGVDTATAEVEQIEAEVQTMSVRVNSLALIGELDQARTNQTGAVSTALRDDLWWGRILDSIANATDDNTYLTSMNLARPVSNGSDDASIASFNGVSRNQAAVGEWLDSMANLGIFEDIWLVQSTSAALGQTEDSGVVFLAHARLTADARAPRALNPGVWLDPSSAEPELDPDPAAAMEDES